RRRGLTLMQLLVLLALLLVLLGFLLAATARVRQAAERAESLNNLHQLVLAVHDFGDSHQQSLPPGPANWFPNRGLKANSAYGPILFPILPYIEQDTLYKSTRKNIGDTPAYVSWEAAGKSVKVFLTKADPTFEKGSDRTSYLVNGLALTERGARMPASF